MSYRVQPSEVIERIFQRLVMLYGASFTRQWTGVDPQQMKDTWARELAGFEPNEILRGLDACRARPYPPTLPEFLQLCRPPEPELEVAFAEAARLWPSRIGWSHPAVYWAAAAIGNDIRRFPYSQLRGRFKEAYGRALANPVEIPPQLHEGLLEYTPPSPEDVQRAAAPVFEKCRRMWPFWGRRP